MREVAIVQAVVWSILWRMRLKSRILWKHNLETATTCCANDIFYQRWHRDCGQKKNDQLHSSLSLCIWWMKYTVRVIISTKESSLMPSYCMTSQALTSSLLRTHRSIIALHPVIGRSKTTPYVWRSRHWRVSDGSSRKLQPVSTIKRISYCHYCSPMWKVFISRL